jgi:nitrate reductase beta subunit
MWWNNVETKPGVGFPKAWEDQRRFKGGWETKKGDLRLKTGGPLRILADIFHSPAMPSMEDYYEPWELNQEELVEISPGIDQPVASARSSLSGRHLESPQGPNFDDELAGSERFAKRDPNLSDLEVSEFELLGSLHQVFFSLPRICNHCVNPACVAGCPTGAIYKRGEDGITLVDQKQCRGWRQCVAACPYKKVYFNWARLKAEKCIYCYPLLERNQIPACFQSCAGRARYIGYLLYDADRIEEVAKCPTHALVEAQRSIILDPSDPAVALEARRSGISAEVISAAARSPVYRLVVDWKLAFPLHPEFRTLPMAFYVPPVLPQRADRATEGTTAADAPKVANDGIVKYLARLLTGENEAEIRQAMRKIVAVRKYQWALSLETEHLEASGKALENAGLTPAVGQEIWKLAANASAVERFVLAGPEPFTRLPKGRTAEKQRQSSGIGTAEEDSK